MRLQPRRARDTYRIPSVISHLWYSFNHKTRIKEGRCANTSGGVNGAVILHDVELFSPSELGQQLNCFIHAEGCKPQWMP